MSRIYTRKSEQEKRRELRKNMTKAEVLLWIQLKNRQMLGWRFLRQYSVSQFVLDFYCPKLKLAIEVDGVSHLVGDTRKYDRERQAYVEQLGITFLRFWNTEIYHNLDEVLEVIRKKIVDLSKQSAARLQSAG